MGAPVNGGRRGVPAGSELWTAAEQGLQPLCAPVRRPAASGSIETVPVPQVARGGRWIAFVRQVAAEAAPFPSGQPRRHVLGQAQRLADLADGAAGAVVDDGRAQARAVAAVFGVDVLDHLLAPLVLEIDVDVGRLVAVLADEALEEQVVVRGIDRGDAEDEAHRAVGGRTASLAQDP